MSRTASHLLPLLLLLPRAGTSQTAALSLTSGSGAPGSTISLDLSLSSGGVPLSALQWKTDYWPVDVASIQISAGPAATSAGKSVTCALVASSYHCVLAGINVNTIPDGVVARASVRLSSKTADLITSIRLSGVLGASPDGSAVAVGAGSGAVLTIQQPPRLSGLGCSPGKLVTPGAITCNIALLTSAPAGGLKASISSGSANLKAPESVTVAAGAKTASFSVTASQVTAAAMAQVQATLGSITLTTTVDLEPPGQALSLDAVVNAASYLPGAVAPGEIVSLYGLGMGPVDGAVTQPQAGQFGNTLADVRVLFDSVAAPLLYVRADVINAVAPYRIAGRSTTGVQVEYRGMLSNELTVPVAETGPGIFALDSSGAGQGAILNQDSSVNSPSNPAAAGSIVVIYATGEGQTKPASVDGRITSGSELPQSVATVEVFIGGVKAQVLYKGAAPSLIAGALQVNVRLPGGIAIGPAVPVSLVLGGVHSPPGITLAVL